MLCYKQNAISVGKETFTEDDFIEMLNETYEPFRIGSLEYSAGDILKKVDPIAFRCALADAQVYKTVYRCPICGFEHDDILEALNCCPANWIDDDDDTEADNE